MTALQPHQNYFGASSKQVEQLYADGTYSAGALYRKPGIKLLVDFITNPAFMATGNACLLYTSRCV